MFRKLLWLIFLLSIFGAVLGTGVVIWGYGYVTRDLPQLASINDYHPAAVTKVYSADGTVIAEFFKEKRYKVI